ncbi:MAG: Lipid carrier : UDP-N-acetylgalactosaminyltransferase [Candidatus Ozemobacter sibiricus]|jgi:glycosyltransferase involved in cell wall biosynthesis|uniref:Lipid carrier: UDP-N-acetylgalactosaminyltransferase n=1 Tax=Candidatus Ozemobacter sibiricus TaxID=2268124 RepID=A0A367ZSF4_9BACT|nr:MAG: Lipid carrier : UDP-N-acetylgalactosaminyltransferase [Candidatus Ozemobacter sibiricus]
MTGPGQEADRRTPHPTGTGCDRLAEACPARSGTACESHWGRILSPGLHLAFLGNQDFTLWKFRGPWMKALREHGCRVTVLSPPGPYVPRLRELGLEVREFPLDRTGLSLPAEWRTIRELGAGLAELRPDLLHVFMAKPVIYGCLAAHRTPQTRVVATITGLGSIFVHRRFRGMQFLLKTLYRISLRRASRVIFQNADDREFFQQHRLIPASKAVVIRGNGIVMPGRPRLPRDPRALATVLMTARLIESKGVREYCQAAGRLRQRRPALPSRFVLIGTPDTDSPDALSESELATLTARHGVQRLGYQDDVAGWLQQADIFCLPSYREGLSVACLEAMAHGLPIVTTDAPGCRDLIEPGVSGLLAPVADAQGLADAIERLLDDAALRARLGEAGRERCQREFSAERIFPQLAEVYAAVLPTRADHALPREPHRPAAVARAPAAPAEPPGQDIAVGLTSMPRQSA